MHCSSSTISKCITNYIDCSGPANLITIQQVSVTQPSVNSYLPNSLLYKVLKCLSKSICIIVRFHFYLIQGCGCQYHVTCHNMLHTCHKVITTFLHLINQLYGCHNLVITILLVDNLVTRLSQGCHKFVIICVTLLFLYGCLSILLHHYLYIASKYLIPLKCSYLVILYTTHLL